MIPENLLPVMSNGLGVESAAIVWNQKSAASELKATSAGFELYFPDDEKWGTRRGMLMSRYEYVKVGPAPEGPE